MMVDLQDDITLELSRLQRSAIARIRERMAAQQLGEAWVGLEAPLVPPPALVDSRRASA